MAVRLCSIVWLEERVADSVVDSVLDRSSCVMDWVSVGDCDPDLDSVRDKLPELDMEADGVTDAVPFVSVRDGDRECESDGSADGVIVRDGEGDKDSELVPDEDLVAEIDTDLDSSDVREIDSLRSLVNETLLVFSSLLLTVCDR